MKESVKWGMTRKSLVLVVALIVVVLFSNVVFAAGNVNGAKAKAQWTFIVFLNGVNNLDPYGDKDVVEMKKIGSSADVNVLVLQGHMSKPFQTFLVKKGSIQVLANGPKIDMGDYKEMVKFVKWCHENYPAEKYLVDIWNHGAGWKNRDKKVMKGISYDDLSGNHMTTPQLGEAMRQIKAIIGHNLDVLGMDACLMQMMEVGYEVRDSVNHIAASEETEPGNGWPYDLVLGPLVKNPTMDSAALSTLLVQAYKQAYASGSEGVTQSAVDCSKLDAVNEKLEALAKALMAKLSDAKVKAAIDAAAASVQVYAYDDNCDLVHFCQLLNQGIKDDAINKAANELIAVVASAPSKAVISNMFVTDSMKNSNGLAIYLPKTAVASNYKDIALGKTAWAAFIKAYRK